jgi:hypothetical protein
MNDEERADWLARAIDDLLSSSRQRPKEPPPPELERSELNALLRIAGERIESSETHMQSGLQYEGEVWQGVLRNLDRRRRPRKAGPSRKKPALPEDQLAAEHRLEQMEIDELRAIAKMRRQLAEQAASIAETHRDDVWQRVVSRLHDQPEDLPKKRWRFPFLRRKDTDNDPPAEVPEMFRAHGADPDADEEVEGLMQIVRTRSYWSELTKKRAATRQDHVWTRVSRTVFGSRDKPLPARPEALVGRAQHQAATNRHSWWPNLIFGTIILAILAVALGKRDRHDQPPIRPGERPLATGGAWWARFAAVAALALVAAALGALPATGFADHPLAAFGRSVAERVGVRETASSPPIAEEPSVVITGREVTIEEASALLGAPVRVPPAPERFTLAASRFFDAGITAESGTYALTYAGPDGASLAVYQERASGADVAAGEGAVINVALGDGTAAAYVEGAWEPSPDGASLTWNTDAGRSLIFERAGLRTTIQYTGTDAAAPSLFALAETLTPAD